LPGCRVAGVPGGVYNRTICRSLSRTREVRRSANQIGIPPLVHCHKMAALNQPDSAYCAPPPGAPLAARHEKLRLSIHFYRSCFSVSLFLSPPLTPSTRFASARTSFSITHRRSLTSSPCHLSLTTGLCSIVRHTQSYRVHSRVSSLPISFISSLMSPFSLYLFPFPLPSLELLVYCIPSSTIFQTKNKFDNCFKIIDKRLLYNNPFHIYFNLLIEKLKGRIIQILYNICTIIICRKVYKYFVI